MNSTKIVVISLVLLLVLFFIGLSLNLIEKPEVGENSTDQEQQAATLEYSWPKAVNNILGSFADTVTTKDLSFSNCLNTKKFFTLNKQSSRCTIKVTGFSETFKKLSLKPNKRTAKLDITYRPTGKSKEEFSWPPEDQETDIIDFVIMGKEEFLGKTVATINIECTNCTDQNNVKITFE